METAKQVGIWIRVSTEDQARGDSPEHHEKRAQYYSQAKGWNAMEVYHLEAVSGKSVMNHPEARRMLQDIKTGRITGLIFSKLARLARNTKELLEFADIFKDCGADLISIEESIDTSTPAGRLFYTMIAAMAQWEREEIASRVAASVPIRAKLGKPLGGQAPFGYRWDNKLLVPDSTEAPVRKLMYELFSQHHRKSTVAKLLNEAGFRTRNGSKFTDTTVGRLLRDPLAKGQRRVNYTKSTSDGKKWITKPKEDWVYVDTEAVVSEDLWNQCNYILDEQEIRNRRPARKTVYLFSGLVTCICGKKMYVVKEYPKYYCNGCHNKVGVTDLEEVFKEQLKGFLFTEAEIDDYYLAENQGIADKEILLQALLDEEKKLQAEMDSIYSLYISKEITQKGFGQRYKPLELQKEQIEEQIPELQAAIDFAKIQYLSNDQLINDARDIYTKWPDMSDEAKRDIVESIVDSVIVNKDEIEFTLNHLPLSQESSMRYQRTACGS